LFLPSLPKQLFYSVPTFDQDAEQMNTIPLTDIAPEIFRKRLLIEGYFTVEITEEKLEAYFSDLTSELGLTPSL
jgi:hypothetical protein